MLHQGQGAPMSTAGAAGSQQRGPMQQGQQGQQFPAPGQSPQYPNQGYQPGHTAGGPPGSWQGHGVQGETPLGVGYSQPNQSGYQAPPQGVNQGQGQQPQGQQQGHQIQLGDDMILDGPNVPHELRGRTFGQVKKIYQALASDWVRRQTQPQGAGQPQPQGQAPQGQQPPQGYGQQPQQFQQGQGDQSRRGASDDFYIPPNQRNGGGQQQGQQQPQGQGQPDLVSAIREAMSPLFQREAASGLMQARQYAAQSIPDFNELEGDIMQMLSGASPEALANPAVWEGAADLARGRKARARQNGGQGQGPYQQPQTQFMTQVPGVPAAYGSPQQPQTAPTGAPQGWPNFVPANQQPHPGQFFSEGPTPPAPTTQVGLSPMQRRIAEQFNMDPNEYAQWSAQATRRGY